LVAWIIHQLTGLSYSVTVHAHDIFVDKSMLKTKLSDATFIAAISKFNRSFLAREVGEEIREKTHIIHCGIVPSWYSDNLEMNRAPEEPFEIINISSLQPYKGQIYLLEACVQLREWGIPFRCRIIGEGDERSTLKRFIETNDLRDDVQLLGALPQEKVAELLPTAHCYVQPSVVTSDGKMEGIPVALMEALASGLPVVATRISGIPELIRSGETGLLVPPEDVETLASALKEIFQNKGFAAEMAMAGRNLVLDEFDLDKNVELLAARFQQVIVSNGASKQKSNH